MRFRVALVLSALVISVSCMASPSAPQALHTAPRHASPVSTSSVDAGASTGVLQATKHAGDPGYNIVTAKELFGHARPASPKTPFFHGGTPSRPYRLGASARTPATSNTPPTPKIAVYNNLNSPGMSAMLNTSLLTPPDSTGAIGPNDYVEMNNSNIASWNRSTLNNESEASIITFLGAPPSTPLCDPQVQWDPAAGRWFFSVLYCNINDPNQFFLFGWSKTSNPQTLIADNGPGGSGGWCFEGFLTGSNLFDYVKLGHNAKYMIFGGNYYSENPPGNANPPFVTSQIVWIPKPANGDTSCTLPTTFSFTPQNPLKNGDGMSVTFTPVPVNTASGATDGYVVSAYDPSGSNGQSPAAQSRLAVWHVDNNGMIHQHPDIPVNTYDVPSSAPELGSTNTIDTLDARLTQAVGDPTTGIWTQHTVDGPGGRSVADWYEITVAGGVASLAQAGAVSSPTDFVFNAAISPQSSGAGGAAIFYNRSSTSHYTLVAAEIRHASTQQGTMEPNEKVLVTGSGTDTDQSCQSSTLTAFPCRWGDYSAASPDPIVPDVVWGTNMFILPFGGGPTQPDWDDENFAVQLVASPPNPPLSVTATAGDTSADVIWSPAAADSLAPVTEYTINTYQGVTLIRSTVVSASALSTVIGGLTNGTTYTFTITASSGLGASPESLHSGPVTPTRAPTAAAAPPPPPRGGVAQATPSPPPPRP